MSDNDYIKIQSISDAKTDIKSIRSKVIERNKDPELQEFLTEFKDVLSKTKTSLEKGTSTTTVSSQSQFLPPVYSDLQAELTEVLQEGISFLKKPEVAAAKGETSEDMDFLQELKNAVNLGIENLEHVVKGDYREKKGRVSAMKMELEEVFKIREEMNKSKKTS
jgi:hypothetical protein